METLSAHDITTFTAPSSFSLASPLLDHMDSPEQLFKMEDIHNPSSISSPTPSDSTPSGLQMSPSPVIVQSRPAKKRKSWGQELPEPTTTLPPRKRAKTDDEKEQRRIERIKRNRAAAHNSRERKRQETETLAVALAHANAKLEAYRQLHGPLPASVILPEVHLCTDDPDDVTTAAHVSTPAPSLVESHGSQGDAPSPASPAESIFLSTHHTTVKQEPSDDSCSFNLPLAIDNLDAKSSLLTLDLTQHSAAMLCDLPCRSSPMSSTTLANTWWTDLFLSLMAFQLRTCYKTLLVAIWTLSPSRMARLMQASTLRSTSRSTTSSMTLQPFRSMPRRLALSSTATGQGLPVRRQSLREVRRTREEPAARRARTHQAHLALSEQGTGREDQAMGDDGHENGVRRGDVT